MNSRRAFVVALVSIVGGIATMMGVTIPAETLTVLADNLDAVIGGLITLYGVIVVVAQLFRGSALLQNLFGKKTPPPVVALLVAVAIAAALTGCMTMAQPQTTDQKIAYAQATLTGLVNSTATLVETGRVSKADALQLRAKLREADTALRTARGFAGQELPQDAVAQLQLAQKILIELNAYLVAKEGGK